MYKRDIFAADKAFFKERQVFYSISTALLGVLGCIIFACIESLLCVFFQASIGNIIFYP